MYIFNWPISFTRAHTHTVTDRRSEHYMTWTIIIANIQHIQMHGYARALVTGALALSLYLHHIAPSTHKWMANTIIVYLWTNHLEMSKFRWTVEASGAAQRTVILLPKFAHIPFSWPIDMMCRHRLCCSHLQCHRCRPFDSMQSIYYLSADIFPFLCSFACSLDAGNNHSARLTWIAWNSFGCANMNLNYSNLFGKYLKYIVADAPTT